MGTVNAKPVLSYVQYAEWLSTLHKNKESKLFFKESGEYTVLAHKKDDAKALNEGYNPLTLNRITDLGREFKNQLISDPHVNEVALHLHLMASHKVSNENQRLFFIRYIRKLIDCAQNYFQGHGFQSTVTLTDELGQWLITNKKAIPRQLEQVSTPVHPISNHKKAKIIRLNINASSSTPTKIEIKVPNSGPQKIRINVH